MAVDLGTAFGRIVVDGRGAAAGFGVAQRGALSFGKAAGLVATGLAAAFAVGVGAAVRTAADFEQAMADLGVISGATGAQLERLSEQALRTGASTRFSATETAAAQLELAKAGVSVADILGGGLEGALALAAAGNLEVADAATIAANAMNLFGLRGRDVTAIADSLAVAANVTTADVADFGMALTQGGAAAKAAGLDLFNTVGILEALAAAGVKNSDAGTSLKAALLQLINPTAKQAALSRQLGLELFTQNGELKDAAGLSAEFRRATEGMTKAERTRTLATLAGTDGLRTLLALYDAGPQRVASYVRGQQQAGAAADVAADRMDSLRGDLEELQGAVETVSIRVGTLLIPVLRDGAVALAELVASSGSAGNVGDFAEVAAQRLDTLASAAREIGQDALPVLRGGLEIVRDGLSALEAALTGAAPVVVALANAAIDLTGAVVAIVGPIVAVGAAIAQIPGAATVAAAALVGLGAGFAVVRVASILAPTAQLVGLFLSLAASAGTAAAATTALGLAQARLAASFAVLTGPVGIAALGIGALVAGVTLLSSGMFSGRSSAEVLADGMDRVNAATRAAAGAVREMDSAVNRLADTQLAAKDAALRVREAEAELSRVRGSATATPLQLQRAELNLQRARQDSARATRDATQAQRGAAREASEGVAQLVELALSQDAQSKSATEQDAILRRVGARLGLTADGTTRLTDDLNRLRAGSGNTAERLEALQAAAGRAAARIKGTGPVAQAARRELEAIAKASPGQLRQYVADIEAGTRKGQTRAQAAKTAIQRLLVATGDVSVPMGSFVSSIRSGVAAAEAEARAGAARIRAALRSANADERQSPSANDIIRAAFANTEKATRAGLRKVLAETKGGADAIRSTEQGLADALEAIDARNEARDRRAERRRLSREAARPVSEDFDRAAKNRAEADLRRFDAEERRRRQRLPVEAAASAAQAVDAALSGVEQNLAQVGQLMGQAIDEGLQAGVAGLDAVLRDKLGTIDRALRDTLARIANGPEAQRIAAIGAEVESSRTARTERDAQRRGAELGGTLADAQAVTARRRASLAGARTASERAAAQKLLAEAIEAERVAAEAVADFTEDRRIAALEAERAALEERLQVQRDAATTSADQQRAAAQAEYDAARQALEERAALQRAQLDRQLGDLAENLRAGELTFKQARKRLRDIAEDPALAADLERSGRTLGLSFSRGLERSIAQSEDAAHGFARAVARFLVLRSPAEDGPLRFDFRRSGSAIGEDFAAGLAARRALVANEAERVAAAARVGVAGAGLPAAGDPREASFVQQNTFNVEGPTLEPRTIAEQLGWEARFGGRRAS